MTNTFLHLAICALSHIAVCCYSFLAGSHFSSLEFFCLVDLVSVPMCKWNSILNLCKVYRQALRNLLCFECLLFDILAMFKDFLSQFQAYGESIISCNELNKCLIVLVSKMEELTCQFIVARLPNSWVVESEFLIHVNSRRLHCLKCLRFCSITECKHSKDSFLNVFPI